VKAEIASSNDHVLGKLSKQALLVSSFQVPLSNRPRNGPQSNSDESESKIRLVLEVLVGPRV
jgi:hypothetical protein